MNSTPSKVYLMKLEARVSRVSVSCTTCNPNGRTGVAGEVQAFVEEGKAQFHVMRGRKSRKCMWEELQGFRVV